MPAVLRIWPNRKGLAAAIQPGHASLEIGHNARRVYISWWPNSDSKGKPFNARQAAPKTFQDDLYAEMGPDTRANLAAGRFDPRIGQTQLHARVGAVDRTVWVQWPQETLTINGKDDPGANGIGLNLERICDWWDVFQRGPNPRYRFVSTTMNCASVVGTALMAGGATAFTGQTLSKVSSGWHTPMDVLNFARKIEDGINYVLKIRDDFPATPLRPLRVMTPLAWQGTMRTDTGITRDLMTYENWIRLSKVDSLFARRKEQIARIDELLRIYHGNAWTGAPDGERWLAKQSLLTLMLDQVHQHMREKPNSDRAEAVFVLGKQLLDVIGRT